MAHKTNTATNMKIAGKTFTAVYMLCMLAFAIGSFLTNQILTGSIFIGLMLIYPLILKLMLNSIKKELALH